MTHPQNRNGSINVKDRRPAEVFDYIGLIDFFATFFIQNLREIIFIRSTPRFVKDLKSPTKVVRSLIGDHFPHSDFCGAFSPD